MIKATEAKARVDHQVKMDQEFLFNQLCKRVENAVNHAAHDRKLYFELENLSDFEIEALENHGYNVTVDPQKVCTFIVDFSKASE